jgi:hypothetical protein
LPPEVLHSPASRDASRLPLSPLPLAITIPRAGPLLGSSRSTRKKTEKYECQEGALILERPGICPTDEDIHFCTPGHSGEIERESEGKRGTEIFELKLFRIPKVFLSFQI